MQGAVAVLPAFASPAYLTHKASSSVAAAIISGTPLLADEALLRAYSYLPKHAVFEQVAGEPEASAMARVAAHSYEAGPILCHTRFCGAVTPSTDELLLAEALGACEQGQTESMQTGADAVA